MFWSQNDTDSMAGLQKPLPIAVVMEQVSVD